MELFTCECAAVSSFAFCVAYKVTVVGTVLSPILTVDMPAIGPGDSQILLS